MALRTGRLVLFASIAVSIGIPFGAHAAPACAGPILTGCRCATDTDIAAGLPAGMPVCGADIKATNADKAGPAKKYLASILRGGSCGPYRTTFEELDPEFAICAARFLEDARKREPRLHIVSAFRSKAHQAYLCGGGCGRVAGPCAPAGSSKHQRGIALDLSTGSYILPGWIQQMGRGYGVHFPVRNDSGHMEPMPGSNCADPNFKPTDTSSGAPFGLGDIFRKMTQPAQQPQVQQALPQTQQQGLQSAFQPVGTAAPVGTTGVVSTIAVSAGSSTGSASGGQPSTSQGTSTEDLLSALAYGTSTGGVETPSVTFVPISIDTTDVSTLRPTYSGTEGQSVPGGSAYVLPSTGVPNTFTSPDLNPNMYVPPVRETFSPIQATLEDLKVRLLNVLGYLQPFALRNAGGAVSE